MHRSLALLFALAGSTLLAAPASNATMAAHLRAEVTRDDGYDLVKTLASWEYEGRMTGQPGQHLTAALGAERLAAAGLAPGGDDGTFLQHFTLATNKIHSANLEVDGHPFAFGPDFVSRGDGGSGNVAGEAVYVGYGISDPEGGYDDYANVDVTGKIAVALRGSHPEVPGDWGLTGWKVRAAKAHGAVGLVLLAAQPDGTFGGLIGSVYFSNGDIPWDPDFPAVQANVEVAKALFAPSGRDLFELIRVCHEEKTPMSMPLGANVHLVVDTTMDLAAPTENVIGILEGSDPRLKNEVIVIGGHMDHVGLQGTDVLFCGQEDNASGSATVIALAEALGNAPTRPKRTIVFMLYTGEEMGLLGSRYWLDHPTFELSRLKAMLNFDMPGQGEWFMAHNGARTPQIDKANRDANALLYHLKYETTEEAAASDHQSFWEHGVPAVMYLNGGERKYPVHEQGEWQEDGLNWELWEQVTETAGLAAWMLANAPRITDQVPTEVAWEPHHACW